MEYRLRRADPDDEDDLAHLKELHKITFEDTAPIKDDMGCIFTRGAWWLMHPVGHEDAPIAFCGVTPSTYGPTYTYLKRGGVLKEHRGQGLQRRLIRIREKWARSRGYEWMITNTTNDNPASANSMIAEGYRLFWPSVPWDMKTAVYLRKRLLQSQ